MQDRNDITDPGYDIVLLGCGDQRRPVTEKVSTGRIEQIDDVQQIQTFLDRRRLTDQAVEERHHCKPGNCDKTADHPVAFPVKLNQCRDLILIVFRQRFIQRIHDRTANAKFRQTEHGKDIRKKAIDTQIINRQGTGEDHTADYTKDRIQYITAQSGHYIQN